MNKLRLTILLAGFGLLFGQTISYAATTSSLSRGKQFATDQILVKFKPKVTTATRQQLAQTFGAQAMQALGNQPDLVLAKLAPGQTVEQAVTAYSQNSNVAYAQPDYIYRASTVPNDLQYGQLWAAKNTGQSVNGVAGTVGKDMNLEAAWSLQTNCGSVLVAVVDSGVNYNATDLAANMWTGNAKHGQNFAADGVAGDPMDLNGHGTHVAGIIGAVGNNTLAGTGVCWQANIMAVRVLDAAGSGTTSSIISGINYAVSNGAKIINMSLGGTNPFDQVYSDAITNAQNNNVLVIVAAGNNTQDNDMQDIPATLANEATPIYPCNFTQANLICVAALDQNYDLASFSNWGLASVDVGAPGTNIYSTWAGISTVAFTDLTPNATPTLWTATTSTSGGWAYTVGEIVEPLPASGGWGTTQYNVSTDDRVYRTFDLAGANGAYFEIDAAINVRAGDNLNINFKSTGGDPFTGGMQLFSLTNYKDLNVFYPSENINITPCISATCSIGVQLLSNADADTDIGVALTKFKITTMTLNSTSYNTINGTSMATPEVAGVAALVWAYNPLYTYADVANAVKNGGRSTASLNGKTTTGKAVDALGALTYINRPSGVSVVVH